MTKYTEEELGHIYQELAGPGIWKPLSSEPIVPVGPQSLVYLRFSELRPAPPSIEVTYWKLLRSLPCLEGLQALAFINDILTLRRGRAEVHQALIAKFLPSHLKAELDKTKLEQIGPPARPAIRVAFTRVTCLLLMRQLIAYGMQPSGKKSVPVQTVGELALAANDFLQLDTLLSANNTSMIEIVLQFAPTWDLLNPSDLAYALPRMFTILTDILRGGDPRVRNLSAKLGLDPSSITIDGMPLTDYLSVVFGLYAFGRKVEKEGKNAVVFDCRRAFERAPAMLPLVDQFIAKRSLTISEFREQFHDGSQISRKDFLAELRERSFLTSGLNPFRRFPLLRLDANRAVILDLQFVVDLLTSGVYWTIFDGLRKDKREAFRELWGYLFELYCVDLLTKFYPPASRILHADVAYRGGQIDALLNLAGAVVVFEVKSSLLTEAAKRSGDRKKLEEEINVKFIRNERRKPKAVTQLVTSCKSIESGVVPILPKPNRIYPVLVADEPTLQTTGFNIHLNDIFQSELGPSYTIRPLTVMTVNEFEEMLPYVSTNVFGWSDLLETRFTGSQVIGHSIHQSIYDWLRMKGGSLHRNEILLERFEGIFEKIKRNYQFKE